MIIMMLMNLLTYGYTVPLTGDTTHILLYIILAVGAVVATGLCAFFLFRKKL